MGVQKIISIVSPVAAGKTFIALNLAAAAAQTKNVALIDLDFNERAVHTWLNLPPGYKGLDMLLSDKCVEPLTVAGVRVYAADPRVGIGHERVREGSIDKIKAEITIVDMPREMEELHKKLLAQSSLNLWIGDPDYHHLLKIRDVIDREPFLVINKYRELQAPLDYKELFGVEPEKIPALEGVYDSILMGEPLVCSDAHARKLFERLYQKITLRVL